MSNPSQSGGPKGPSASQAPAALTPLTSLRAMGLTNEAIGTVLAATSGRPAPSPQRVHDWLSGIRPTPQWVIQAAAAHLCRQWQIERRTVADVDLPRCDARWAARIDPVLGELYAVLAAVPDEVAAHMRPLMVAIRRDVETRLAIEIPGV